MIKENKEIEYCNPQSTQIFKKIFLFSFFTLSSCVFTNLDHQLDLQEMEIQLEKGEFPKTTSVLVSQKGKMVYEKYFGDGRLELLNDTRSVTKSITSIVAGKMIQDGNISGVEDKISTYLNSPLIKDDLIKADIRIKDLLTMSSAFLANDNDDLSPGYEDNMHKQDDWLKWIINLPVKQNYLRDESGFGPFRYATINAVLMGNVIEKAVAQPVDKYIINALLNPLGIDNYEFQYSPMKEVMTGGGLRLRSRDLLKVGELVQNKGVFQKVHLIPKDWINECLTVHRTDDDSGAGYGYYFWNFQFPVSEDKRINGWFMAGNGGNIVLILPELKSVIVVTRTNYNSPTQAMETIQLVSKYIIPKLL
ncbi:MAG TPA: class C beta-lactamase-related serine hydrolase [Flavobacteriaceae bacterium]|nr:class C beta-lactamase-related serine hydrolase [Flavobacteriaceae bacterium]